MTERTYTVKIHRGEIPAEVKAQMLKARLRVQELPSAEEVVTVTAATDGKAISRAMLATTLRASGQLMTYTEILPNGTERPLVGSY